MHDFRRLSPLDFESLVRDLLQAEWGQRLESFGPGRDGGIDFRYASGENSTIVQVKHYADSPPRALLRAAEQEDSKVAQLATARYVFVTSLPLTPGLKDKIIAAMPSSPLARSDVIGKEDLNNLLGRHGGILKKHFKLWLTDSVVLERIVHSGIYNRTEAELEIIKRLIPRFVHNGSIAAAEDILQRRGALIVAGDPGVGKTTLARTLTWLHLEQEWNVFVVSDLKEAMEVCTSGLKRLIVLDDFLGQISLTNDTIRDVDQRLPVFLERLSGTKDVRFILTTREYLLHQAQQQSSRLSSAQVSAAELVLNVGTYTRMIRAQIVFNHIYFSDLTPDEKAELLDGDFYMKMIDHRNFSPRLIDLLTQADYHLLRDAPLTEVVASVLANPSALWETPYREHLSEDSRTVLRALYFQRHSPSVDELAKAFERHVLAGPPMPSDTPITARFRRALRPVEGSFVSIVNGYANFSNPGVRDFLSSVFVEDRLLPAIVSATGTPFELDNAWSFYQQNRQACRQHLVSERVWLQALTRIHRDCGWSAARIGSLAIEMLPFLEECQLELAEFTDELLRRIGEDGVEVFDELAARHALEHYQALDLDEQELLPSIGLLTDALATMLGSAGEDFSLDEINSLASVIGTVGNEHALARRAAGDAFRGYLGILDKHLDALSTFSDYETFESELQQAAQRYGVPLGGSEVGKLGRRRNELEDDQLDDQRSYTAAIQRHAEAVASDLEVKSLFATLRVEPGQVQ